MYQIVETLATWKWDARSRLKDCYHSILLLTTCWVQQLPNDLLKRLEKVKKEMTKFPAENEFESNLDRTMKKIYNKTASKLAQELFDIYQQTIS